MHVLIGALIVAATFLMAMQYMSLEFDGFFNVYSAILLGGVPIGLVLMSYRFGTIGLAVRGFFEALFKNPSRDRDAMANDLIQFGREVRRDKGLAATSILEKNSDPVFRHLGRHVLQSTSAEELESDAAVIGARDLEASKAAARVLSSLGDFAPAMGMIGTVIGLIQLLANMRDFEKLGPGMAIALLTTFYGLLLAHLVYLPLARLVNEYVTQRAANINLVIEGMLKLSRKRPIHEVQEVVGASAATTTGSVERAPA